MTASLIFCILLIIVIRFAQNIINYEGEWGTMQWVYLVLAIVAALLEIPTFMRVLKENKQAKLDAEERAKEIAERMKKRSYELYMMDCENSEEGTTADEVAEAAKVAAEAAEAAEPAEDDGIEKVDAEVVGVAVDDVEVVDVAPESVETVTEDNN